MDEVVAVRVGELLRGRVRDLRQDERGERGGGRRGGRRVLGEDGGVVGDAGAAMGG